MNYHICVLITLLQAQHQFIYPWVQASYLLQPKHNSLNTTLTPLFNHLNVLLFQPLVGCLENSFCNQMWQLDNWIFYTQLNFAKSRHSGQQSVNRERMTEKLPSTHITVKFFCNSHFIWIGYTAQYKLRSEDANNLQRKRRNGWISIAGFNACQQRSLSEFWQSGLWSQNWTYC